MSDVGMVQRGENCTFLLKTVACGRMVAASLQHLDGDFFVEGAIVAHCFIDRPHATVADHAGDAPRSESQHWRQDVAGHVADHARK